MRLRIAIVDDEDLARAVVREYLAGIAGRRDRRRVRQRLRGGQGGVRAAARPADPRRADAEAQWVRGARAGRPRRRRGVRHGLRSVRDPRVRGARRRLPAQAVRRRSARRGDRSRARAARARRDAAGAARWRRRASRRRDTRARILVRDGPRVHVLPVEKIDYVQAQDDYVCFRCEGKEYLKEQTLGELEATLDPAKFVRIHRSFVLNLDRLARVEPTSARTASRSSPTADACRSAAPATRASPRCWAIERLARGRSRRYAVRLPTFGRPEGLHYGGPAVARGAGRSGSSRTNILRRAVTVSP